MSATSSLRDFRLKYSVLLQHFFLWLSTYIHLSSSVTVQNKMRGPMVIRSLDPHHRVEEAVSATSSSLAQATSNSSSSSDSSDIQTSPPKPPENVRKPSDASFLGIPAELRNEIYRLALLQNCMIKVGPQAYVQPGLLRTNRQIRHEALSLWLTGNDFKVDAWDMKLVLPPNYSHHWLRNVEYKRLFITLRGKKDWANLKKWLRRYVRHEVPGLAPGQPSTEAEILAQAFEMVFSMMDRFSFDQMGPIVEAWMKSMDLAGVEFSFW